MRQFLSLALASAAIAAPANTGINVPIGSRSTQNADGTVNEAFLLSSLNRTLLKYGHAGLPAQFSQVTKRATGNLPLKDQVEGTEDELYYGPATVGRQVFQIDYDTGSADLFVPGPKCGQQQGCIHSVKYDEKGQAQNKQTTVTYGSGQISGNDFKDTVTVAGLNVPSQGFISLTDSSGFTGSDADGLMGMGFSTIANTGFPTFFENLIAQGKVTAKEFSFYLGRAESKTNGNSAMLLGGRDTSKFSGTPKANKVTKKGYWQIALDSVKVNKQSAGPTTKGQAAIDTGTTIVLGPTAAVSAVFTRIPGAVPLPLIGGAGITLFAYPCNTAAKNIPSITFGGTDYAINPLDFNFGSLTSSSSLLSLLGSDNPISGLLGGATSYCIAGLGGADLDPTQNLYVVGDTFLKNWYSIYNYDGPNVLFAAAKGNNPAA